MKGIDEVQLNFDEGGVALMALNLILGLVMFGVSLDLRWEDFKRLGREPKGPLIGLATQFLLLPALSTLLVFALRPAPSLALGMMLVAACPGGNLSNFLAHLARGRTVLSVTMTACSTALAILLTPLNVQLWASVYPPTAALVQQVSLDPLEMVQTVLLILGLPLVAGMLVAAHRPALAAKLRKPFKVFSLLAFGGFILAAFGANLDLFLEYIGVVFWLVLAQNAAALALGYGAARLLRLDEASARAISIEVGIQNSGLGLVLIFQFFDKLGGMALIAAWYGIWHIIAGLSLAMIWARRPPAEAPEAAEALVAEPEA